MDKLQDRRLGLASKEKGSSRLERQIESIEGKRHTARTGLANLQDCPRSYKRYNAYSLSSQTARWSTKGRKLNAYIGQDRQYQATKTPLPPASPWLYNSSVPLQGRGRDPKTHGPLLRIGGILKRPPPACQRSSSDVRTTYQLSKRSKGVLRMDDKVRTARAIFPSQATSLQLVGSSETTLVSVQQAARDDSRNKRLVRFLSRFVGYTLAVCQRLASVMVERLYSRVSLHLKYIEIPHGLSSRIGVRLNNNNNNNNKIYIIYIAIAVCSINVLYLQSRIIKVVCTLRIMPLLPKT